MAELDETIDPKRARELVASERAQAVDLRGDDDFASGHIAGALRAEADDLEQATETLDEDRPVIVVCADGERSAEAATHLRERGFEAAAVAGGMKAWTSEGLPVQPRETEEFEGPKRPGPLGS
jgi:rhodanese-related sulfurtransferase